MKVSYEINSETLQDLVNIRMGLYAPLTGFISLLKDGALLAPILRGTVSVRGKIWQLLPLVSLLRAGLVPPSGEASS